MGAPTLQLLTSNAQARRESDVNYRFCKNPTCDVVYFADHDTEPFRTGDVSVPVFQKSTDPDRLVCYCFDHTSRQVRDDALLHGTSTIADSIRDKCHEGLDRCEELNPQGRCCLGNVRQLATEVSDVQTAGQVHDCCAPNSNAPVEKEDVSITPEASAPPRERNLGMWSAGGALGAAILSSACCWLPLALIGVGTSAAGVAGFFEAYRLWFLGGASLLLGGGFYYVYFRKPTCAPGEACEVPNPRLQRFNRVTLWVATIFIVAFAAFPEYVGLLFGGSEQPPPPVTAAAVTTRTYAITGMTCGGCEAHVKDTLMKLPDVVAVEVSYADELASVETTADLPSLDHLVVNAIKGLGYDASPNEMAARAP